MIPADFHNALAEGPEGGQAWWVSTSDGVRIRIGGWHAPHPKGTILMFTGRTEYIEKYGRNAADFVAKGYNVLSLDWRGQGLSDRLIEDVRAGHVETFVDYQRDLAALMAHADDAGFAGPYYLIAHSMGGTIGLRALCEGLDVKAVAFSSPMWGIALPVQFRPFANLIAKTAVAFGHGQKYIVTGSPDSYVATHGFDGNELTNDADMYAYMQRQVHAVPQFALGSPTMKWLRSAFEEIAHIQAIPAPDVPCLTYLGTNEEIVNPSKVRKRASNWPGADLVVIEGGRHEMLMDVPGLRGKITDEICSLFAAQGPA